MNPYLQKSILGIVLLIGIFRCDSFKTAVERLISRKQAQPRNYANYRENK